MLMIYSLRLVLFDFTARIERCRPLEKRENRKAYLMIGIIVLGAQLYAFRIQVFVANDLNQ